jgi:hypothetical protein
MSALDVWMGRRPDFNFMHARDSAAKLSTDPSMPESSLSGDQTAGITTLSAPAVAAQVLLGSSAGGSALASVASFPVHITSLSDFEGNRLGATPHDALTHDGIVEYFGNLSPTLLAKIVGPALFAPGATVRTAPLQGQIGAILTSDPADPLTGPDSRQTPALPHAAGLIAEALPLDGRSLQQAIDQFLDRLPELDLGQFKEEGPARVVPYSLVFLGAVVAALAVRRRFRGNGAGDMVSRERDSRENDDLIGFPELPGSWSTRVT